MELDFEKLGVKQDRALAITEYYYHSLFYADIATCSTLVKFVIPCQSVERENDTDCDSSFDTYLTLSRERVHLHNKLYNNLAS